MSVRLTAFGRTDTRQLVVRMDPRVKTPAADLEKQFALSARVFLAMKQDAEALRDVKAARARVKERKARTADVRLGETLVALDERLGELEGAGGGRRQRRAVGEENLARLNGQLAGLLGVVEGADVAPTTQASAAVAALEASLARQLGKWKELSGELAAIGKDVTPKK